MPEPARGFESDRPERHYANDARDEIGCEIPHRGFQPPGHASHCNSAITRVARRSQRAPCARRRPASCAARAGKLGEESMILSMGAKNYRGGGRRSVPSVFLSGTDGMDPKIPECPICHAGSRKTSRAGEILGHRQGRTRAKPSDAPAACPDCRAIAMIGKSPLGAPAPRALCDAPGNRMSLASHDSQPFALHQVCIDSAPVS